MEELWKKAVFTARKELIQMDERIKTLAYNLVHFSCKLEKGEKVWISCNGVHPLPLVKQIIKETYRVGAIPFVKMMTNSLERELLLGATEEQQKIILPSNVADGCLHRRAWRGQPDRAV